MEDIEKLKKIAKLSQEMRKHGFATYHDEAVKAAEAVYKDTIATADTPEQRHAALQESKRSMANNPDFEKQISQRLNDIEANLSSVIGKMNEMIKEINTLQQGGGARAAPREAPREKETQKPLAPAPEQKPAAAPEPHARSGNYTPQDVQIDKIFYYGNKK